MTLQVGDKIEPIPRKGSMLKQQVFTVESIREGKEFGKPIRYIILKGEKGQLTIDDRNLNRDFRRTASERMEKL